MEVPAIIANNRNANAHSENLSLKENLHISEIIFISQQKAQ